MAGAISPLSLFGAPLGITPSISPSAASSINAAGAGWDMGGGDWNVNLAGSGTASQGLSAGGINWLYVALAGAAWLLLRR